jgi:hypothetical protein
MLLMQCLIQYSFYTLTCSRNNGFGSNWRGHASTHSLALLNRCASEDIQNISQNVRDNCRGMQLCWNSDIQWFHSTRLWSREMPYTKDQLVILTILLILITVWHFLADQQYSGDWNLNFTYLFHTAVHTDGYANNSYCSKGNIHMKQSFPFTWLWR